MDTILILILCITLGRIFCRIATKKRFSVKWCNEISLVLFEIKDSTSYYIFHLQIDKAGSLLNLYKFPYTNLLPYIIILNNISNKTHTIFDQPPPQHHLLKQKTYYSKRKVERKKQFFQNERKSHVPIKIPTLTIRILSFIFHPLLLLN